MPAHVGIAVGTYHHGHRIPADVRVDLDFQIGVARIRRLQFDRDGVDVGGVGRIGNVNAVFSGLFDQGLEERVRPLRAFVFEDGVERVGAYLTYPAKPEGAWVSISAQPLRDETGAIRGAVAVSRDVTAERQAHEQLIIADRMASIGMMASTSTTWSR